MWIDSIKAESNGGDTIADVITACNNILCAGRNGCG